MVIVTSTLCAHLRSNCTCQTSSSPPCTTKQPSIPRLSQSTTLCHQKNKSNLKILRQLNLKHIFVNPLCSTNVLENATNLLSIISFNLVIFSILQKNVYLIKEKKNKTKQRGNILSFPLFQLQDLLGRLTSEDLTKSSHPNKTSYDTLNLSIRICISGIFLVLQLNRLIAEMENEICDFITSTQAPCACDKTSILLPC